MDTHGPRPARVARQSASARSELLRRLQELVPAAFREGELDWEALHQILGGAAPGGPARYRLTWAGKDEALQLLQRPTTGTLVPVPAASLAWDHTANAFIEGENLEVLKILLKPYYGRVKLIYIDPPYNTGQDFIYKDDYREPLDAYLQRTGQADSEGLLTSNPETAGRYHSEWLSMMYPRLWLARELLRDDGLLCVSIDDHEVHNLRILLDEVFGPENFRNTLIVRRGIKSVQAQFNAVQALAVGHEYIVVYSKNPDYKLPHLHIATEGRRGSWNSHWRGTDRPTLRYELFGITPESGQWRWSRERSLQAIANYQQMLRELGKPEAEVTQEEIDAWYLRKVAETGEEIDLLRLSPTGKPEHYVPPAASKLASTLWTDLSPRGSSDFRAVLPGVEPFDNPKPVAWIRRLLELGTSRDGGDIVLDFFAGSGTTAQAVWELNAEDGGNRRFILVQIPAFPAGGRAQAAQTPITAIAQARLRAVVQRLQAAGHQGLDLGFRVFRLAPSQFKVWQEPKGDALVQLALFADSLVEGWDPEAVVAEVALKEAGFGLGYRVEEALADPRVYRVQDPDRDQHFYICLDGRFPLEAAYRLPLTPETLLVVRDVALDDTTAATLAARCRVKVL